MKTVQINSVYCVGSTGKIAKDISSYMIKEGVDSKVFYGYGTSPDENAVAFSSRYNVAFNVLKTRLFGKHAFYSKCATKKLIKLLRSFNPDVIHIHQIHGHYLNVPILFNYLATSNAKIIFTLHDCWMFTGHCAHFYHVNCEKWKTGCGKCPQLSAYPKSLIFDRSSESWRDKKKYFTKLHHAVLVCPSRWLFNYLPDSFLNQFDRTVINNGIDTSVFKLTKSDALRKKFELTNQFVVVGMAAKWLHPDVRQKAITLINSLKNDIRVVLIGVNQRQKSLLPKQTVCVPYISSSDELAKYYSLGNVFVNLSLEDTFPTVNLEALACGLAIIAFNAGGSAEVIDDDTGISVPAGDFDGIKDAIYALQKSTKDYQTLCRKKVVDNYDKENCYEKYFQLYKNEK